MKTLFAIILSLVVAIIVIISACVNTSEESSLKNIANKKLQKATFAGGCFWCMEPPFEILDGVEEVIVGYTGGEVENPSYEEVLSGTTGHYEAVQISYNPEKIIYEKLLEVYWRQIDPTDAEGQFADQGLQYKTAIFYHDQTQKELAEKSKLQLAESGKYDKPIVTDILPYKEFYIAEDYHQDYYQKNPARYEFYKRGSGREDFIKENWPAEESSYEDY